MTKSIDRSVGRPTEKRKTSTVSFPFSLPIECIRLCFFWKDEALRQHSHRTETLNLVKSDVDYRHWSRLWPKTRRKTFLFAFRHRKGEKSSNFSLFYFQHFFFAHCSRRRCCLISNVLMERMNVHFGLDKEKVDFVFLFRSKFTIDEARISWAMYVRPNSRFNVATVEAYNIRSRTWIERKPTDHWRELKSLFYFGVIRNIND